MSLSCSRLGGRSQSDNHYIMITSRYGPRHPPGLPRRGGRAQLFARGGQGAPHPAAVSQAVRRLESDLGEQLFDRTSKSGTLTDAGRVLQNYGQRLVRLAGRPSR